MAMSYDKRTKLTYGLLLSKTGNHEFQKLIQGLKQGEMYCQQPMLVPALVVDVVTNTIAGLVQVAHSRLNKLEETMGQHEYVNRPKGNPLDLNFQETTNRLNFIGRTLAAQRMRIGATLLNLEKILQETKDLPIEGGNRLENSIPVDIPRMPDNFRRINELIAYQSDACQNLMLRVEFQEKRTQLLIGVVYQFMAQKDSKVNIELAQTSAFIASESKKDNSAMKTIALLTMCFLPGTFLAALFAMPFFNWDGDGLPIVKQGFKYYWAIAIPLTVLVLGLWALAMLLPWTVWWKRMATREKWKDLESAELARIKNQ